MANPNPNPIHEHDHNPNPHPHQALLSRGAAAELLADEAAGAQEEAGLLPGQQGQGRQGMGRQENELLMLGFFSDPEGEDEEALEDFVAAAKALVRNVQYRPITPELQAYTAEQLAKVRMSPESTGGMVAVQQGKKPPWATSAMKLPAMELPAMELPAMRWSCRRWSWRRCDGAGGDGAAGCLVKPIWPR